MEARQSVWSGIDPVAFYKALERPRNKWDTTTIVVPSKVPTPTNGDAYPFPITVESELAEYFAFLAAWKSDPEYVSAATVAIQHECGLLISIAANRGIGTDVSTAFESVLETLRTCAQEGKLSRRECCQNCLRTLVELHTMRITERLEFRNTTVADRLQELANGLDRHPEGIQLAQDIHHLVEVIQNPVHQSKENEYVEWCLSIVDAAYRVTRDGVSLADRLRTAGVSAEHLTRREWRAVIALANYRRICIRLCECARSYRRSFAQLRLNVVQTRPAGTLVRSPKKRCKLCVHAEIQLLLYHETTQAYQRPRTIAASKDACFACAAFISSFGTYVVQRSHGEMYPKWTILDSPAYNNSLRMQISVALRRTFDLVEAAKPVMRPGAQQSTVNLLMARLRTPSLLSMLSRGSRTTMTGYNSKQAQNFPRTLITPTKEVLDTKQHTTSATEDMGNVAILSGSFRDKPAITSVASDTQSEREAPRPELPSIVQSTSSEIGITSITDTDYAGVVCVSRESDPKSSPVEGHSDIRDSYSFRGSGLNRAGANESTYHPPVKAECEVTYIMAKSWLRLNATMQGVQNVVGEETAVSGQNLKPICTVAHCSREKPSDCLIRFEDIDDREGILLVRPDGCETLDVVLQRESYQDLLLTLRWTEG